MGKLFQLHIVIVLLCLFCIEQSTPNENLTNSAASKCYISRCHGRVNTYNALELAEEEKIIEACVSLSGLTNAQQSPILINALFTACHSTAHDNIPFNTDKSPPAAPVPA